MENLKDIKATVTVDARGTYCPGPLMELIKEIRATACRGNNRIDFG